MAFQPVPNTAQVEVIFLSNSSFVENVYHVEKNAPWTAVELSALCGVIEDWWRTQLAGLQAGTLVLQRIDARDLTTEAGAFFSRPCVGACSGTGPDAALPNNVTAAVKWTTGLAGRSQRGRTYHLGLMESQVVGDNIAEATRAALQLAYGDLRTDIDAMGPSHDLVVVSRISNGVPRPVGQTTPITSASVDNTVDSQRRRLIGRGT